MHATLEQPVTYRELDSMYGTPKDYTTRRLIIETITKTVRKVDHRGNGLAIGRKTKRSL